MQNPLTDSLALASAVTTSAHAGERLPTIPPAQYTDEQKKAAEEFVAARKVPVFGERLVVPPCVTAIGA